MDTLLGGPGRYVQGPGLLKRLGQYTAPLGQGLFVVTDPAGRQRMERDVREGMAGAGPLVWVETGAACCEQEARRLAAAFAASGCGVLAGAGGGRHLDLAKAAAHFAGAPAVMLPTAASTDAPCSAAAVLYTPEGLFQRYLQLAQSPALVLADTAQIAAAPPRLLAAGMGDALATWFEARACAEAGGKNGLGGTPGTAALALARACWYTLREYGTAALAEAQEKRPGPALERIVEANICLSGIGFESGGLAAAHAVNNGLAALPAGRASSHGEKVAFGTLVQLVLEQRLGAHPGRAAADLAAALAFCRAVGLPTTLEALGCGRLTPQELARAAALACAPADNMGNMPFAVSERDAAAAVLEADRLGRR